jgi:superoxide reductase
MAELGQIYKCNICGNIAEILHKGSGSLVCCNQEMELMDEKSEDSSVEKHVPFIKRENGAYVVIVGKNALHPMEENHFIEWIELNVDDAIYRKFLKPGNEPKAVFEVPEGEIVQAREHCNLHGLWKN